MSWHKSDEVYCRRKDLFGICATDESDGKVMVKWDWPWDPKAPPEEALELDLEDADEVRARYRSAVNKFLDNEAEN